MSNRFSAYRTYFPYWRAVTASGFFSTIGAIGEAAAFVIISFAAPVLGQSGTDNVSVPFGPLSFETSTGKLFGLAAGLITMATITRAVAAWIGARAQASWAAGRRRAAIKAYLAAPYSYIVRQRAAQLHELMGQHANVAGSVIANLSYGLNSILALLVFMISALVLDPTATVVFFLLGTLSIVGLRPLLRWTKGVAKRLADRSIDLGVTVEETTGVVREIKTLGVRKAFEARFEEEVAALATYSRNLNFSLSTTPQVYIGLGMLVLLAAFAAAARFSDGSFATLGGTALLLFRALSYGQQMSGVQQRLSRAHPYAAALNGFIDEARAAGKEVSSGTISLSAIDTIEFVDTSFLYDLGEAPAVKNASFKLERPGLIAVVGPSGTGKITVAHLALGLLQPRGATSFSTGCQ